MPDEKNEIQGPEDDGPEGGRELPEEEVEGAEEEEPRSLTLRHTHHLPKGYQGLNHEKLGIEVLIIWVVCAQLSTLPFNTRLKLFITSYHYRQWQSINGEEPAEGPY